MAVRSYGSCNRFLLTHPVWDVTHSYYCVSAYYWHFYSHIPCGMWRQWCLLCCLHCWFLLTHPVWDVTACLRSFFRPISISTHTSRVGCDRCGLSYLPWSKHFYSHIPCGMWLKQSYLVLLFLDFYSHIPCGMWLLSYLYACTFIIFLLTHPVWDVTKSFPHLKMGTKNFYSHIPCGMWLGHSQGGGNLQIFLLTHPVWDVTNFSRDVSKSQVFLLTHPVWDVTVEIWGEPEE